MPKVYPIHLVAEWIDSKRDNMTSRNKYAAELGFKCYQNYHQLFKPGRKFSLLFSIFMKFIRKYGLSDFEKFLKKRSK